MTFEILTSFFTLTALEIVLGIDNIIFISIVAGKLSDAQRELARKLGLLLAVFTRLLLLAFVGFLMKLNEPVFLNFSVKEIILICGGLFLIWKGTKEIHDKIEGPSHSRDISAVSLRQVLIQILLIDIVFSLDSIITAVGLVNNLIVMSLAVIVAVIVMIAFSGWIVALINKHPTVKVLALAFIILVGVLLVAEGFGSHFDRGYVYFAMAFSAVVEAINIRVRNTIQDGTHSI
ncbi:MAG: TerC family protein [Deltaproteobacteria bacterium]|nr:TerC family protein [Deltaproteobacteria bacterium]